MNIKSAIEKHEADTGTVLDFVSITIKADNKRKVIDWFSIHDCTPWYWIFKHISTFHTRPNNHFVYNKHIPLFSKQYNLPFYGSIDLIFCLHILWSFSVVKNIVVKRYFIMLKNDDILLCDLRLKAYIYQGNRVFWQCTDISLPYYKS